MRRTVTTATKLIAVSLMLGTALLATGCGNSSAKHAQSPPPPSLSAPVRAEPVETVYDEAPLDESTSTADSSEYDFLAERQSTPLPRVEAPAAELPAPTAAPFEGGTTYTMQKGDTLYKVARMYNVPPKKLIAANSFPDPNKIPIGAKVVVPQ